MTRTIAVITAAMMLACGGGGAPVGEPLTDVPAELACLEGVTDRPPGSIADIHAAAEMATALKSDPAAALAKACDPTTTELELGYAVYAFSMSKGKDKLPEILVLLDWEVRALGNPQASAKLARLLASKGPDRDPVRATGLSAAANDILVIVGEEVGRGQAIDMATMNIISARDNTMGDREILRANSDETIAVRDAVIATFESRIGPIR